MPKNMCYVCPRCKGKKRITTTTWRACVLCNGTGVVDGNKCFGCDGLSVVNRITRFPCPNH